ncbi:MAG: 4Fe-4S binding protein [Prevotellaceae bacterium]|jgi:polyferredoxin|nr:4Fe-4S binding protein [Prevotellaceae bacterium]
MAYRFLKKFRVVLSLVFFLLLLVCFVDTYHLTGQWSDGLLKWQFVPALLSAVTGSVTIILLLVLLTLLFGRVYCSTLCPLGTYQDIVRRIANWFKNKKKRKLKYSKPHHLVRYLLLGVVAVGFVLGSSTLLLKLDPYSNFGRMAANLLRPAVIWSGNALSNTFSAIPFQDYKIFTMSACLFAAAVFIVVTTLSALRGRLYCNSICPVGSLLGVLSKYSLFRLALNSDTCARCMACVKACKGQCIDIKKQEIDHTRCVQCHNCTSACRTQQSIRYQFAYQPLPNPPQRGGSKYPLLGKGEAGGRRLFLGTIGGIAAAGAVRAFTPAWRASSTHTKAITPPGSRGLDHFKRHCTACHACVAGCPSHVLRPAVSEYGLDGFMMPVLDYNKSFCNYACNTCSTICPNGAIIPLSKEEKILTQIGKANFILDRCIVVREETDCGACDEHCPVKAIRMVPFRDGLLIPQLDTSLCIGCGGCEYICPARPDKAIQVIANTEHQQARPVEEDVQEQVEVDDFGF